MKSIHNMTKTELINYIETQKNNQTVGFENPFEDGNSQEEQAELVNHSIEQFLFNTDFSEEIDTDFQTFIE